MDKNIKYKTLQTEDKVKCKASDHLKNLDFVGEILKTK